MGKGEGSKKLRDSDGDGKYSAGNTVGDTETTMCVPDGHQKH